MYVYLDHYFIFWLRDNRLLKESGHIENKVEKLYRESQNFPNKVKILRIKSVIFQDSSRKRWLIACIPGCIIWPGSSKKDIFALLTQNNHIIYYKY